MSVAQKREKEKAMLRKEQRGCRLNTAKDDWKENDGGESHVERTEQCIEAAD